MGFIKSLYKNSSLNEKVGLEMSFSPMQKNDAGKLSYNLKHSHNLSKADLNAKVDKIFNNYYSNSCSLFKSYRKSAIKSSIKQYISEGKTTAITQLLQHLSGIADITNDEQIKSFAENYYENDFSGFLSVDEIKDIVKNKHRISSILIRNNIISINRRTPNPEVNKDKIPRVAKNTIKEINDDLYLAKHLTSYSQLRQRFSFKEIGDKYTLYRDNRNYKAHLEAHSLDPKENPLDLHKKEHYEEFCENYTLNQGAAHKQYFSLFQDLYDGKIRLYQLDNAFMASFEDKFSKSASRFLQTITLDKSNRELINHGKFVYKTLNSISKFVESSNLDYRRATLDHIKRVAGQAVTDSKGEITPCFSDEKVKKMLGKGLTKAEKQILLDFTEIFDEQFISETHLYCKLKKPKSDSIINLIGKRLSII